MDDEESNRTLFVDWLKLGVSVKVVGRAAVFLTNKVFNFVFFL